MSAYLNVGNKLFREALAMDIYVDKSKLISFTNGIINKRNKLVCVSRPRRFGKSMALEMLNAYYSRGCDSRDMFQSLKVCSQGEGETEAEYKKRMETFWDYLNSFNVLWLDMQGILGIVKENMDITALEKTTVSTCILAAMQKVIIKDLCENTEYGGFIPENEYSLGNALYSIYNNTGRQFVVLIDEWDCIFRNYENDRLLQDKYVEWLRNMFKNSERMPMYSLVYMTGILPIKRYGTQSALNNFNEYTMLDMAPLEEFAGFTEEETFELYNKYGMDIDLAKEWYDGYELGDKSHIYNPRSVVCSIEKRRFNSYWAQTGIYESVKGPINRDFDGMKEKIITLLGGGRVKISIISYNNTMNHFENADDVLTLLVHLGYLAFDFSKNEVYIPNKEVRQEFAAAIRTDKWKETNEAIDASDRLLKATIDGDEKTVSDSLEKIHRECTSILKYNDENSLSCAIQIAYYCARDHYMMIREMPLGKGFCNIVFIPKPGEILPGMIVELKWNKSAKTAIDQIKTRDYCGKLSDYYGDILLVGINYDKDRADKKHSCRIERIVNTKDN